MICEHGAGANLYNTVKEELEACTYSKCSVSDPVYGEISSLFFFVGHSLLPSCIRGPDPQTQLNPDPNTLRVSQDQLAGYRGRSREIGQWT